MQKKWVIGMHMHEGIEQSRRVINGMLKYLEQQPQLELRDFNYLNDDHDTSGVPPWLGKVDGVVLGVGRIPGVAEWLKRGRVPVVNTAADLSDERSVYAVYTDAGSIAKTAIEHFKSLGSREIAFVGFRHSDGSHERKRALTKELQKRAMTLKIYDTSFVMTGSFRDYETLDDVEPKLLKMIKSLKKPGGIICLNDRFAATVCRIVKDLNFSIPEDVAILGVGDFETARMAPIPISSLRTDNEKIGFESIQLLHRLLQGEKPAKRIRMIPLLELTARESTLGKRRATWTDVDRAMNYIHDRAFEGIRVEDVASYVHMPLRTFEIEFSKAIGHSVGHEIRQTKLKRAQILLRTTDLPLRSIARLVGLADAASLSRFLVRWSHMSAMDYRNKSREENE